MYQIQPLSSSYTITVCFLAPFIPSWPLHFKFDFNTSSLGSLNESMGVGTLSTSASVIAHSKAGVSTRIKVRLL